MIVTCPECLTRFSVGTLVINAAGRMVRCGTCSHVWLQGPEESPSREPDADAQAFVEAVDEDGGHRRSGRFGRPPGMARSNGGRGKSIAWAAFASVVAVMIGGGYFAQPSIIGAWPQAERIYALFGLESEPAGSGLDFRNVSWSRTGSAGDAKALVVRGEVANVSDVVRDVPMIRGILFDEKDRRLQHWIFTATERRLLPGEIVGFKTKLDNPVDGAVRLTIAFDTGN